jgi:hypothetical protein
VGGEIMKSMFVINYGDWIEMLDLSKIVFIKSDYKPDKSRKPEYGSYNLTIDFTNGLTRQIQLTPDGEEDFMKALKHVVHEWWDPND